MSQRKWNEKAERGEFAAPEREASPPPIAPLPSDPNRPCPLCNVNERFHVNGLCPIPDARSSGQTTPTQDATSEEAYRLTDFGVLTLAAEMIEATGTARAFPPRLRAIAESLRPKDAEESPGSPPAATTRTRDATDEEVETIVGDQLTRMDETFRALATPAPAETPTPDSELEWLDRIAGELDDAEEPDYANRLRRLRATVASLMERVRVLDSVRSEDEELAGNEIDALNARLAALSAEPSGAEVMAANDAYWRLERAEPDTKAMQRVLTSFVSARSGQRPSVETQKASER